MTSKPWHQRAADHWHRVAYTLILSAVIIVYALHFISPGLEEFFEPILKPTNLLMIILMYVALIAAEVRQDREQLHANIASIQAGLIEHGDIIHANIASIQADWNWPHESLHIWEALFPHLPHLKLRLKTASIVPQSA